MFDATERVVVESKTVGVIILGLEGGVDKRTWGKVLDPLIKGLHESGFVVDEYSSFFENYRVNYKTLDNHFICGVDIVFRFLIKLILLISGVEDVDNSLDFKNSILR